MASSRKSKQQQSKARKGASSKAKQSMKDYRTEAEKKVQDQATKMQSAKQRTWASYEGSLRPYFKYLSENVKKDSERSFRDYCTFRQEKRGNLKPLAPSTVPKILTALRKVIQRDKKKGWKDHWTLEPDADFKVFMDGTKRKKGGEKYAPSEEFEINLEQMQRLAIRARAQGKENIARYIEFTWWGGLRREEGTQASLGRLYESGSGEFFLFFVGTELDNKTNFKGWVPIGGNLPWLTSWKAHANSTAESEKLLLFPNISTSEVDLFIKRAAVDLKFPTGLAWNIQGLREGRSVYLNQQGSSLAEIRIQLKHKQGSTVTVPHYLKRCAFG